MKSRILLFLLIFLSITTSAQNLNMTWINHINSSGDEGVKDMKVDQSDDMIISAVSSDTLIFGIDTLTGYNSFIMRFGSIGNFKDLMINYPSFSGWAFAGHSRTF